MPRQREPVARTRGAACTGSALPLLLLLPVLGYRTPDVRQPLDEARITMCVADSRVPRSSNAPMPLSEAVERMRRHNPRIQRARAAYWTALAEILGLVEARHAAVEKTLDRLRVVDAQLTPADETQDLAQQILDEGGSLDMLRFLEVLRTTRRIRIQHVQAKRDAYDAWSALEVAGGSPLLHFASAP